MIAGACGSRGGSTGDSTASSIAVTTSMWADVVANVVGAEAEVSVLIPAGTDPHSFEPSARDRADLDAADLIVTNGLGLDDHLTAGLDALRLGEELAPDTDDPHIWMNPDLVVLAVDLIAEAATSIEGVDTDAVADRAADYQRELERLALEVETAVACLPADGRRLVTQHRALGHFAERFGFEVIGTVISSTDPGAEPAAGALAELTATIGDQAVPAIFTDTTSATQLAETAAAEVGASVAVVPLFIEELGDGATGAGSYVGAIRIDARLITSALDQTGSC